MPGKFFTSQGSFDNTDIDDIFEPIGSFTKVSDVGYVDDGVDISNLYAPAAEGSPADDTGFKSAGGVDLGQLFAAIGSVVTVVYELTGPGTVDEGESETWAFTGTDVPLQNYWWRVEHGTSSPSDFSGNTSGTFNYTGSAVNINLTTVNDGIAEPDRSFTLAVYDNPGYTGPAVVFRNITIIDAGASPFFTLVPNTTNVGTVGSTPEIVTFTLTGENSPATGTFNWTVNTTTPGDFDEVSGTVEYNGSPAPIEITILGDIPEGTRSFTLSVDSAPPVTSVSVSYSSDFTLPATYDIIPDSATDVVEGNAGSFEFFEENSFANQTVLRYWRVVGTGGNPATTADFVNSNGFFNVTLDGNGDGDWTQGFRPHVEYTQAGVTESDETFVIEVRDAPAGGGNLLATSGEFTILNRTPVINIASATAMDHGTPYTVTLTGQNVSGGTNTWYQAGNVYWEIIGSASAADFNQNPGTVAMTSGTSSSGSFTLTPTVQAGEPEKTFQIRIRTQAGGNILATSDTITIAAGPPLYSLQCTMVMVGPTGSGVAEAGIRFNSNGSTTATNIGGGLVVDPVNLPNWRMPLETNAGSAYEIRAVALAGPGGVAPTSGPALNVWHSLGSAREWAAGASMTGSTRSYIQVTIRDASTLDVVAGPENFMLYAIVDDDIELPEFCGLTPGGTPPPPGGGTPPPPGNGLDPPSPPVDPQ